MTAERAETRRVASNPGPVAALVPYARNARTHSDEQVAQLAAYVASRGPGPGIPDERWLQGDGDAAIGGELFRINCAMCHNVAGAGGALTEGKYAPALGGVEAV